MYKNNILVYIEKVSTFNKYIHVSLVALLKAWQAFEIAVRHLVHTGSNSRAFVNWYTSHIVSLIFFIVSLSKAERVWVLMSS